MLALNLMGQYILYECRSFSYYKIKMSLCLCMCCLFYVIALLTTRAGNKTQKVISSATLRLSSELLFKLISRD